MKKLILIILVAFSFNLHAQRLRPFVGLSLYKDTEFNKSIFGSVATGLEFKVINNFRPELQFDAMYGALETLTDYDINGNLQSIKEGSATAINYSICSKIYLGNPEVDEMCIVILPKYTLSKVFGKSEISTTNTVNPSKPIIEKNSDSTTDHSFGIGVGVSYNFSEKYYHSVDFILYLNGVNLGAAINKINNDTILNSRSTFGCGFLVYFGGKIK